MKAPTNDRTQYRYKQTATRPHHPGIVLTKHDYYENDDYVFFWESLFSNWEPGNFEHDFVFFNCSEQAMMYHKAMCFGDAETAAAVMRTRDPKEQKRLGRTVKGFNDAEWQSHAQKVFPDVLASKFEFPSYKEILLSTGNKTIVEASPFDAVWGINMGVNHPDLLDESKWLGKNLLGKMLMQARDILRTREA